MPFGLSNMIFGEQKAGDVGKAGDRMTEEQKMHRGQVRDLVMDRATREGPTAYEEAMLARAQEQAERQRAVGSQELERALAQRGMLDSGALGAGHLALARQLSEMQAEAHRDVMGIGQQRRQAYTGQAVGMSGQDLQASTSLQHAQSQADAAAAQRAQQQRMQLVHGLGTGLGMIGQDRNWWGMFGGGAGG